MGYQGDGETIESGFPALLGGQIHLSYEVLTH